MERRRSWEPWVPGRLDDGSPCLSLNIGDALLRELTLGPSLSFGSASQDPLCQTDTLESHVLFTSVLVKQQTCYTQCYFSRFYLRVRFLLPTLKRRAALVAGAGVACESPCVLPSRAQTRLAPSSWSWTVVSTPVPPCCMNWLFRPWVTICCRLRMTCTSKCLHPAKTAALWVNGKHL